MSKCPECRAIGGHRETCSNKPKFTYKGLPFMFARLQGVNGHKVEKFVVLIAHHDYSYADTAWMCDDNLPDDKTLRPTVDILLNENSTFEFDTEDEMIQFVSNWYQENYPRQ